MGTACGTDRGRYEMKTTSMACTSPPDARSTSNSPAVHVRELFQLNRRITLTLTDAGNISDSSCKSSVGYPTPLWWISHLVTTANTVTKGHIYSLKESQDANVAVIQNWIHKAPEFLIRSLNRSLRVISATGVCDNVCHQPVLHDAEDTSVGSECAVGGYGYRWDNTGCMSQQEVFISFRCSLRPQVQFSGSCGRRFRACAFLERDQVRVGWPCVLPPDASAVISKRPTRLQGPYITCLGDSGV
ncbi:hypothetical protein BV22DRAFT_97253 [Leucogyrophana mollusca]|uniref:Uncharacterized protein n=1 Tax=Leucogyrophana mollusca TaxID=85980 RepID=A0ACB8BX30_9AGAM|nr:hypothetical protein BV22DRAFT_97253 [Leucogyrophana mollusca]